MLTLFSRTHSEKSETEKVETEKAAKPAKHLLSFVDSQTIASVLPCVHPQIKTELETTHAAIREVAHERMMIYRSTLQPCSNFQSDTPDSFAYKRLSGGYSNCTFQLFMKNNNIFISRIAGTGTELFIDRPAELQNARLAAELGLNPKVIYNDGKKGHQLSVCLSAPQPLTPDILLQNPQYLIAMAQQLKTLHTSKKLFVNDVNIFKRNAEFYEIIIKNHVKLPEEYVSIKAVVEKIKIIFANLSIPIVPCHNDTFYNNFLLSDHKVWLIDWEYSGNHDAMWDLSYLAKLAGFSEKQTQSLLETYFGCPDFKTQYSLEYQRFVAYKLVIDDFVLLWSYVQIANKNTSVSEDEFMKWADDALKSALLVMEQPIFKSAVAVLEEESSKKMQPSLGGSKNH